MQVGSVIIIIGIIVIFPLVLLNFTESANDKLEDKVKTSVFKIAYRSDTIRGRLPGRPRATRDDERACKTAPPWLR